MSSDTQSPHPSSPVKDSAHSIRVHSSPSPVISGATASGTLPDANKSRTRSVAAILRDTSTLLDRNACIIAPFNDEARRDAEFYQKHKTEQMITDLKDKQIEIIALMNSWVFSRLIAENERAGETLAREMDTVAEAEREQERMRIQLENCVSNIRAALAALSRAVM